MNTLYGIKNCDTVKKARKWLEQHDVDYRFHDFRIDGLDIALLQNWCNKTDWNTLLNRRSTTWRDLPDDVRASLDQDSALQLMVEHPTVIRRPVLVSNNHIQIGFSDEDFIALCC